MWILTSRASEGQFCEFFGWMCMKCEVETCKMWGFFLQLKRCQPIFNHCLSVQSTCKILDHIIETPCEGSCKSCIIETPCIINPLWPPLAPRHPHSMRHSEKEYSLTLREAFHSKKQRNLGISPKWWWPPPPSGVGTFLNLGLYWNGLTPPSPKIKLGLFWTWDFLETEWPPKNPSKQVEYETYWYKINQYEWYNGIFGHVWYNNW